MMNKAALSIAVVAVLVSTLPHEVRAWDTGQKIMAGGVVTASLAGLYGMWHLGQKKQTIKERTVSKYAKQFDAIKQQYEQDLASFQELTATQLMPGNQVPYFYEPQLDKLAQLPTVAVWINEQLQDNGCDTVKKQYQTLANINKWFTVTAHALRTKKAQLKSKAVKAYLQEKQKEIAAFVNRFKILKNSLSRHKRYFILKARMAALRQTYQKELALSATRSNNHQRTKRYVGVINDICAHRGCSRQIYRDELATVLSELQSIGNVHYPRAKKEVKQLSAALSQIKAHAQ